jgi:WD40 repeat protein
MTGTLESSLSAHTSTLNNVTYAPDGKLLATVGDDRTVRIWDMTTGVALWTLYGHTSPISGVAFSPDGQHLSTGDEQGNVRIWSVGPDAEIFSKTVQRLSSVESSNFWAPKLSADGKRIYTIVNAVPAGENPIAQVRILDATSGRDLQKLIQTEETIFDSLAISGDDTHVAIGGRDGLLRVLDGITGKPLWMVSLDVPLNSLAFRSDGKWLATPGAGNTAQLWDVNSGQSLFSLKGHLGVILDLAFSADGTKLATTSFDQNVKIWDLNKRKLLHTLSGHPMLAVFFSPDGKQLVTSSLDGTIQIWDAGTGDELYTLSGHTSLVSDVAFSPDGQWLASASGDGTLKLWDLNTHQTIWTLPGGEGGISFSPDGRQLVTISNNGSTLQMYFTHTADLIALAQSRLTRTWALEECIKYLHMQQCPSEP